MNRPWTDRDFATMRQILLRGATPAHVAETLERPYAEVREMARDLGLIESLPRVST